MPPANYPIAQSPVVIGGLGGSGTRVAAAILKHLDFYMGNYTNEQLDNLWFTFLMRRPRKFRSFNDNAITPSIALFDAAMRNKLPKDLKTRLKLYSIAAEFMFYNYVRGGERKNFAVNCFNSIIKNNYTPAQLKWGCKEPNSHLFIEQLNEYYPGMKFILVLRHPLDMAFGNNFLQLYNWHHLFNLPKPNGKNQHELMLAYYDAANSRAMEIGKKLLGENFLAIKLEDLCTNKYESIEKFLSFLDMEVTGEKKSELAALPQSPSTLYRYKTHNWKAFEQKANEVCMKFNYKIEAQ